MAAQIEWLGHATFRLSAEGVKVYIDPYQIADPDEAGLILITHDHYDHCSPDDVKKVISKKTVIAAPIACRYKVENLGARVLNVKPGGRYEAAGVKFSTLPAYNLGKKFHPKDAGGVGYVVEMGGERIYHAGDTDAIPEMAGLEVDVALLPVGGTYTMNAADAARAFKSMKAKRGIPMHYGSVAGTSADAEEFERLIKA
jgi:L-ascorbate metabolism protein UlaG (beta-lactamase superfamily)